MFDYGLVRNLISNIPVFPGDIPVFSKKEETKRVVDCIPETLCDYRQDRMDFSAYFTILRGCRKVLDWTKVPEDARELVKCFSLDQLDEGSKIQTEAAKILTIRKIIAKAEELCRSHSFFGLDTDCIIKAIETIWAKSFTMQKIAFADMVNFFDFIRDKTNVRLAINVEKLDHHRQFLSDILSGYDGEKGSPLIPDEMLDELITGFDDLMRNPDIPINHRMTAGIMLLDTQIGLRNSEIPAIDIDCLHSIEGADGVIDHYIVYNCIKSARAGTEVVKVKTICTDIAKETIEYLLELRKTIPGWENNNFLYIQDHPDTAKGYVANCDTFRNRYKYIMAKYLRPIVEKSWTNIRRISVYKVLKHEKNIEYAKALLSIPGIHSFRVTFASKLYLAHADPDYINAILSHSPMSECNDSYIPSARPTREEQLKADKELNEI